MWNLGTIASRKLQGTTQAALVIGYSGDAGEADKEDLIVTVDMLSADPDCVQHHIEDSLATRNRPRPAITTLAVGTAFGPASVSQPSDADIAKQAFLRDFFRWQRLNGKGLDGMQPQVDALKADLEKRYQESYFDAL